MMGALKKVPVGGRMIGALEGIGLKQPEDEAMRAASAKNIERVVAKHEGLGKQATSENPYLLDKMHVSPKVRQRRAEAPELKHRVKLGRVGQDRIMELTGGTGIFSGPHPKRKPTLVSEYTKGRPSMTPKQVKKAVEYGFLKEGVQMPGVFGQPSQLGASSGGGPMNPAKQLANSQKVGVPKLQAPKMKTLSMKTAGLKQAFQTSQFSGTLGGGSRDIYRPSDAKYGGPPPPEESSKKKKESCGYAKKASAMADELAKLNGVATTPAGKLYQTQRVGAPKVTAPAGPSISELSKPVGYGTKAPGAVKNSI